MASVGRPRKYSATVISTICYDVIERPIVEKFREMASEVNRSFSGLVLDAISDYVTTRYPEMEKEILKINSSKTHVNSAILFDFKTRLRGLLKHCYSNKAIWNQDVIKLLKTIDASKRIDAELSDLMDEAVKQIEKD